MPGGNITPQERLLIRIDPTRCYCHLCGKIIPIEWSVSGRSKVDEKVPWETYVKYKAEYPGETILDLCWSCFCEYDYVVRGRDGPN